jgi:two-component system, NtrC family, sensor kinase
VRVLLVEDDAVSRRLLRSYLEKWGHEVTEAEDGAVAWQRFQAGEFPVVVSDWMMPEMDGLELVRRIRSSGNAGYVYVILITARTQAADVAEGVEAGADEFIRKPVDRDDLRVKLWEAERVVRLQEELKGR